jgi:nucleoside-diphosphate-sugar epimerase
MWFARELARRGHEVDATFTGADLGAYEGLRGRRVEQAVACTRPLFGLRFGDEGFVAQLRARRPDVLCHHGAEVGDYRGPQFDVLRAVGRNTHHLDAVASALAEYGGRLVLTGSVFENDEGLGEDRRAFSLYGLSKGLTCQVFRYWCEQSGVPLGKFVIPNPFGPFEEPRFTSYLIASWLRDETPTVRTPRYVRDNIHVDLLARRYVTFVEGMWARSEALRRSSPSGYVETQGAFAERLAREMEPRFGKPCPLTLAEQADFPEPLTRTNSEPAQQAEAGWNERAAWDGLADYYRWR